MSIYPFNELLSQGGRCILHRGFLGLILFSMLLLKLIRPEKKAILLSFRFYSC